MSRFKLTVVALGLLGLFLVVSRPAVAASPAAEPVRFTAAADQMEFTLPLRTSAPGIIPRFVVQKGEVVLPLVGIDLSRAGAFSRQLDDDWISGYGLKSGTEGLCWYFTLRKAGLPLQSLLAVRSEGRRLVLTVFKPYRPLAAAGRESGLPTAGKKGTVSGDKLAANAGKLAKINAILAGVKEKPAAPTAAGGSDRSLLTAGIKVFAILLALIALILLAYGPAKQLLQKTAGPGENSLVRVLQTVPIGVKQQVMFLEIADEVLVVGICGEQMSLLTRIADPEQAAALKTLRPEAKGGRSFARFFRTASSGGAAAKVEADSGRVGDDGSRGWQSVAATPPAAAGSAAADDGLDAYRRVLVQIRQRLDGMTQL